MWLTVAPQELTLAGQPEPGPLLAAVTAALCEIIHCSNTCIALFAEAEGLEHIHFHVVPRTDHPDPSFRGPFAFAPPGGGTATQVPGQVRDQITSKLAAAASLPALSRPRDEEGQPSGAAQSTPRPGPEATSWMESKAIWMESKAIRYPRKPPVPQISRFRMRTLATTAGICRGQLGGYARAGSAGDAS